MKQVNLSAPKRFEVNDVPRPEISESQVLLKIHAVGICGSDIHAYFGLHPFISCPIVMGHEATGEVAAVGSLVKGVAIGDHVVIRPQKICGECLQCKTGRYNICDKLEVLGCQYTGASSEYYAVESDLVYRLPDGISWSVGTLIEPLAVGVHAAHRGIIGEFAERKILVIGAGVIGNVVAQSALGLGATDVIIADISDYKLEIAKKCGIPHQINVKNKDLKQFIESIYGSDGADVTFECTASESGLNQVLEISRKGTRIVIVGVYESNVSVNMANVQDREYELIGTLMYKDDDYREAINLVTEDKVHLNALISDTFLLEETAKAYTYIEENRDNVQKVVLTVA